MSGIAYLLFITSLLMKNECVWYNTFSQIKFYFLHISLVFFSSFYIFLLTTSYYFLFTFPLLLAVYLYLQCTMDILSSVATFDHDAWKNSTILPDSDSNEGLFFSFYFFHQIWIWCYFSIYKHINFCDQNLCLKTWLKSNWLKTLLKNWKIF